MHFSVFGITRESGIVSRQRRLGLPRLLQGNTEIAMRGGAIRDQVNGPSVAGDGGLEFAALASQITEIHVGLDQPTIEVEGSAIVVRRRHRVALRLHQNAETKPCAGEVGIMRNGGTKSIFRAGRIGSVHALIGEPQVKLCFRHRRIQFKRPVGTGPRRRVIAERHQRRRQIRVHVRLIRRQDQGFPIGGNGFPVLAEST